MAANLTQFSQSDLNLKKKIKLVKVKSLKMQPFSSELPFHIHDWLIISLKDFCFVIRK